MRKGASASVGCAEPPAANAARPASSSQPRPREKGPIGIVFFSGRSGNFMAGGFHSLDVARGGFTRRKAPENARVKTVILKSGKKLPILPVDGEPDRARPRSASTCRRLPPLCACQNRPARKPRPPQHGRTSAREERRSIGWFSPPPGGRCQFTAVPRRHIGNGTGNTLAEAIKVNQQSLLRPAQPMNQEQRACHHPAPSQPLRSFR